MQLDQIDAGLLKLLMAAGSASLYKKKAEVDALNVFPVPDGDTGTNMSLTFQALMQEVNKNHSNKVIDILESAAYGALMGARGNSGVILSQFFRGFVKALPTELDTISKVEFKLGLNGAANACFVAVRQPVEGTILTIIREIAKFANENIDQAMDLADFICALYQHALTVLDHTPEMMPLLKQAGVVDAGGQGLVYFLKGWVEQLRGEQTDSVPLNWLDKENKVVSVVEFAENELISDLEISFQYCTEFILKGKNLDLEHIKNCLGPHGECLLVVGDENTAKIHIHTNNPGIILDFTVRLGDLTEIQIQNMVEQSQQRLAKKTKEAQSMKSIGIVAIASGDGLERIFRNLGAQAIVNGGQTMNPSISDLAQAVSDLPNPEAIILPNNSNIILTANHVKDLAKKPVEVVPTYSIPEGLAALIGFSEEKSLTENVARMIEKTRCVVTGEITFAVRDSQIGNNNIKKGDIIGLINGEITVSGDSAENVIEKALQTIPNSNSSLITIYYGNEVTAIVAQSLLTRLEKIFPNAEVELYYGGQPLYYYLFSVE